MQWTDCEMVWRRVSGWQERRRVLPVAAKPAPSLLGPAPAVCWSCPGGTGGRSGGAEQRDAALQTGQCWEQVSPVGWRQKQTATCRVSSISGRKQTEAVWRQRALYVWLVIFIASPRTYLKFSTRLPQICVPPSWQFQYQVFFFFLFEMKTMQCPSQNTNASLF